MFLQTQTMQLLLKKEMEGPNSYSILLKQILAIL